MDWTEARMEALGQQLLAGVQVPANTLLLTYAAANPARLVFVARQDGCAGAAAVLASTLTSDGASTAQGALDHLLRVIMVGWLPVCSEARPAPLLGYQGPDGWEGGSG